ncbi:carbamoyl phosphate synthase-like protein [Aureliella helgolandensis]|uniref:Carbamoyl phosphate synthase-like protein n=2 Tax=Aureliella helgolandensis TaxID=2527968 RepID=A0A518GAS8_9BACT|nr:carbamoyl phosphate synthase-like protein [Aureliella helgolandensis]
MLASLVEQLTEAGNEVYVAISRELQETRFLLKLREAAHVVLLEPSHQSDLLEHWRSIAQSCDQAVVIAPECGGALQAAVEKLGTLPNVLVNCSGPFLSTACSKLKTARALAEAGISHPPTLPLQALTLAWLKSTQDLCRTARDEPQWIVKPDDGAGCEGVLRLGRNELLQRHAQLLAQPEPLLVQPCLAGAAFGCSAIIDARGNAHWLPPATQNLEAVGELEQGWEYRGGEISLGGNQVIPPRRLVDAALRACGTGGMGWVGVDMLFDLHSNSWTVIEINPRFTTSVVGLASAYTGNLISETLQLANGQRRELAGAFTQSVSFDAVGNVVPLASPER